MIILKSSGLYTSIQDLGRFGHRASGVPVSGAMDLISARTANILVDNKPGAAVLEITLQGPVLFFEMDTLFAITGAGFSPSVDTVPIPMNKVVMIKSGSMLRFGNAKYGVRAYLAVSGGFVASNKLGSVSMCKHITPKERLLKGAVLRCTSTTEMSKIKTIENDVTLFTETQLDVYPGPEFETLSIAEKEKLLSTTFIVSRDSNRMAYKLNGLEGIQVSEIITAPVQPGTVQLMPSGLCAVLMRDGQTTGGYARVLQLSDRAICVLSQKRAGSVVSFRIKNLF